MMRIPAILAALAVLTCPPATSTPITEVAGTWGGDNAGLIVSGTDVHIHIGCTLGDAIGPINPAVTGRFAPTGT